MNITEGLIEEYQEDYRQRTGSSYVPSVYETVCHGHGDYGKGYTESFVEFLVAKLTKLEEQK